jgi:energy-coupling factor transporter ATP-binding protein EcfA2
MPRIDAVVECPVRDSFRVRQVAGLFDLPADAGRRATFSVELPGLDEPWRIGLITGPSGSGKTTIAHAAFGPAVCGAEAWPADCAVVDALGERPIKEITGMLTAVGFSSPPHWLRPYRVLSRGEQFRCDLARALLTSEPLVVFDEFTSVVDRTVARTGAAAVGRAVRKHCGEKRLVAVTCHRDVAEWLEPDWVLDMADGRLTRGRLRRPSIELAVHRCRHTAWRLFAAHHYLSGSVNRAAHCYLATWDDEPVAFAAVLAQPGRRGRWRISRLVVLPDYQGLGVGVRFATSLAEHYRREDRLLSITTSHPAMIAGLQRSRCWRASSVKKTGYAVQQGARRGVLTGYVQSASQGRGVVTFVAKAEGRERKEMMNSE